MRLIDADEIIYESIDSCDTGRHESYYGTGILAVRKEELDDMPTIEERTGHWIDIDSQMYTWKVRCSKCGHERSMMSTQGQYPKFCEDCGAHMTGGEQYADD